MPPRIHGVRTITATPIEPTTSFTCRTPEPVSFRTAAIRMAVSRPQHQLRVVRHESEHDRWEMVFGRPDPSLRPYVVHYCGYASRRRRFTRRPQAPSLQAPLIFHFGPPIRVYRRRAPAPSGSANADGFVAGLDDSYALVESSGSPERGRGLPDASRGPPGHRDPDEPSAGP